MPLERGTLFSFKEKHPQLYNFLYQIILLIITFESAIAIARYGPERDNPASVSATPLRPRNPLSNANSTTPHICKYGAREDDVDLGPLTPLTPYLVLCPSTPFLLLSILTYITGIIKFNLMHKDDLWLADSLFMVFLMTLLSLDWRHVFVSFQILGPINIWAGSVVLAVCSWCFKTFFPRTYERLKEFERRREEERRMKAAVRLREVEGDIEGGIEGRESSEVQGELGEETPLRS